jgi:hypothetical protein
VPSTLTVTSWLVVLPQVSVAVTVKVTWQVPEPLLRVTVGVSCPSQLSVAVLAVAMAAWAASSLA